MRVRVGSHAGEESLYVIWWQVSRYFATNYVFHYFWAQARERYWSIILWVSSGAAFVYWCNGSIFPGLGQRASIVWLLENWGENRGQFGSSFFEYSGWNHVRPARFVRLNAFKLFLYTMRRKVNIRGASKRWVVHSWHIFSVFICKYTFVLFAKSLRFCVVSRANTTFPEQCGWSQWIQCVEVWDMTTPAWLPLTGEELGVGVGLIPPMTSGKYLSWVSRTRLTVALRRRLYATWSLGFPVRLAFLWARSRLFIMRLTDALTHGRCRFAFDILWGIYLSIASCMVSDILCQFSSTDLLPGSEVRYWFEKEDRWNLSPS